MKAMARLVLRDEPDKALLLQDGGPLTIGQAATNRLAMPNREGVSPHHAVVRLSRSHGWLVCDWESADGTFLEGQRLRHCRPLQDGDEIQLGPRGPVLVFQLLQPTAAAPGTTPAQAQAQPDPPRRPPASAAKPAADPPGDAGRRRQPGGPPRPAAAAAMVTFAGQRIPRDRIRSVHLRSRARYPHSFSWWVLVSLGGLVLLPWPLVFWPLEISALVAWILLGARKEHLLVLNLRDGMAHRHSFANRITALAHRRGLRQAIGQNPEDP